MKKLHKEIRFIRILLAIILAAALPLQAFAYIPPNNARILPEAVAGTFYSARLFEEGFAKKGILKAEGLPDGLEIDPVEGIIFGLAKNMGRFEILVTVQSGRPWWRPKPTATLFLLHVLPPPVEEPPAPPLPDLPSTPPDLPLQEDNPEPSDMDEPQNHASTLTAAAPKTVITWDKLESNGKSKVRTTSELYLTFSSDPHINSNDLDEYAFITYAQEDYPLSLIGKSESNGVCIYTLGFTSDPTARLTDGGELKVTLIGVYGMEQAEISRSIAMCVEAAPDERVRLAMDELIQAQADFLGAGNASADKITENLSLPDSNDNYDCAISWNSDNVGILSNTGEVTRPSHIQGNREVKLTATVTCSSESGNASEEEEFVVIVLANDAPPAPPPPLKNSSEMLPYVSAAPDTSSSKSSDEATGTTTFSEPVKSDNVDNSGSLSRTSAVSELKSALQDTTKVIAIVKTQNAESVSPATLKALAAAADTESKRAVIHADSITQKGKVDARLYLKPESLTSVTQPIKLGISTKGERPEKIKVFFDKYFNNHVSVISCEQKGSFGAKLQIAAKIKLPEDTGNLVFYSYDSTANSYSRILTAYRIDANGYLRFATGTAGDIIVSDGPLKKR